MSISNSKSDEYHHGDLRNSLIQASVEMLQREGMEALSLRKLAREIGVSHNAPYMHFPDKEALLAAITAEGFHLLGQQVAQAVDAAGEVWEERFHGGSRAYVRFVLDHRGHAQVMFRYYEPQKYPAAAQAAVDALYLLQKVIEEGQQAALVRETDSKELAALVWSLLHGIATILAAEKMPRDVMPGASPEAITDRFLHAMYAGIRPR